MNKLRLKQIAYFTIFLLLLNSGLSAAAYTITEKSNDGDNHSQRVLLCTGQGFKWVLLSDIGLDNNPEINADHATPSTLEHSTLQHCPFCNIGNYSIDHAIDNTALSVSLNPCYSLLHRVDLVDSILSQHDRLSNLPSRAPPIFS